jgi:mRNA interferase MazF
MKRGDVVIVEIAYVEGAGGKKRPAVVVQNDRDNRRLSNTVVAMISGNVGHSSEATQLFVDPTAAEGTSSGLHGSSVVKCCNLFTVAQADIHRVIGHLSEPMMSRLEVCLKAALDLR